MATGSYRLTAVLAFLLVAGTTAAGWQGGRPSGGAASQVVPLPSAGPAAAIGLARPTPRATPNAAAAALFAPGGVAFHGGSLTKASHRCVHLDTGSARYYHDHLPVGAEVAVF
jgi:hypothetical protein